MRANRISVAGPGLQRSWHKTEASTTRQVMLHVNIGLVKPSLVERIFTVTVKSVNGLEVADELNMNHYGADVII